MLEVWSELCLPQCPHLENRDSKIRHHGCLVMMNVYKTSGVCLPHPKQEEEKAKKLPHQLILDLHCLTHYGLHLEDRSIIISSRWSTSCVPFILKQSNTLTLSYLCKCNPLTYFNVLITMIALSNVHMRTPKLLIALLLPYLSAAARIHFYSGEIIKCNNVLHSHSTLGMFRAHFNQVEIC